MKYKVGDKVRVVNVTDHRKHYNGKKFTIKAVCPNGHSQLSTKGPHYGVGEPWIFWENELEHVFVNNKKIVITTDGTKTLARLYENRKVVKKVTVKRSPDEFDFNVIAKLAFERLTEPAAEKKEEYYNGKVVCVKQGFGYSTPLPVFTIGKIYTVNDGIIVADYGYTTERYKTLDDLCCAVGHELIPFVE
jgi:hypothetical protein